MHEQRTPRVRLVHLRGPSSVVGHSQLDAHRRSLHRKIARADRAMIGTSDRLSDDRCRKPSPFDDVARHVGSSYSGTTGREDWGAGFWAFEVTVVRMSPASEWIRASSRRRQPAMCCRT